MDFTGVKKILVTKLRHIGDVLLTVPVFRALRETFPGAHITAIVNSGTEEVLTGSPLIDEIITLDRRVKDLTVLKRYGREISFLRGIRQKGFDMTVDLTGGDRAAILSFASGARYRIGWKSSKGLPGKRHLYTHTAKPDIHKHMVLQNLDVVRAFGITTQELSVDFHIPEADRKLVDKLIREQGQPMVHIHPTSRWLFKCWDDSSMSELIAWLLECGRKVVITSSADKKEIEKTAKILLDVGHRAGLIDLSGRTTLKQAGAISQSADLFFGVDSAPMHIAAALGTPVVALFGPSNPRNWGPWPNGLPQGLDPYAGRGTRSAGIHTVIQQDRDCIPCGRDGCDGSKLSRCLQEIGVDEVKAVIEEKLRASVN
jgi:heptosyltransferase-3